ncbi:MAG: NUDIX domain-containing protein [Streptosporangiales bacterium]|nr:NUDIX domain-containing protein [Streptosporangiales bacterium]
MLAAVLSVRDGRLHVLLWQRAQPPADGHWALPGGVLGAGESVEESVVRQLAEKVDVRDVAHHEQLAVFSDPHRRPGARRIATAFLGLVPTDADPRVPADTAWCPTDALPVTAFDHGAIVAGAVERLRAKLSYTNIGFALAPPEFTISTLRELYAASLGYDVDATNLQRFLTRRRQLEPTGGATASGPAGGRPASLYRFRTHRLAVTDEFVAFRPPR